MAAFWGLLICSFILSGNNDAYIFSFHIWISLISFNGLFAPARTSSSVRNRCGENGQPQLLCYFSRIALIFFSNLMLIISWWSYFLFFSLFTWWITLSGFHVDSYLYLWDEVKFIMVDDFFSPYSSVFFNLCSKREIGLK